MQGGRGLGPGSDLGDEAPDIGIVQIMLGSVVELTYALEPELWRRYSAIVLQGLRARPEPPAPLDVPALCRSSCSKRRWSRPTRRVPAAG